MTPFSKIEKQEVIGMLKSTGSRDKDVLYATKSGLVKVVGMTKLPGTVAMVVGALFTITIVGAILGVPLLAVGWWLRGRGVKNIATVETVYSEYIAGL